MQLFTLSTTLFSVSFLISSLLPIVHGDASLLPSHNHARGLYDAHTAKINAHGKHHNEKFYKFVTRPDIDAPRWNVRKFNESSISPGYWFVGPYTEVTQNNRGGGWVGPHIFDGNGELVWSGVPLFNGFDTFDFRVANVRGEDKLTLVYRHKHAMIIDQSYHIQKKLDISEKGALNMHDFNFVDNGTSVLMLKTITKKTSKDISRKGGWHRGRCRVRFYGFEELDATDFNTTLFSWSSEGHVGLDETFVEKLRHGCTAYVGWDYIHANAIDKFPDGDYLLSARHCNTILKISGKDGSIVWRLGGRKSDFKFDEHFSGQHDVRVVSQNSSHSLISFLDNAEMPSGTPKYTNDFSRGFLLSLRTDHHPMTAEVVVKHNHPHGEYAPGRGSFQTLRGGNTLIGWTTSGLFTEYDQAGNLVLEASMKANLKSYRNYKFRWTGRPTQPPDIHSAAVSSPDNSSVTTNVHVSWNGATEVASWDLYRTNNDGTVSNFVASTNRQGFETAFAHPAFVSHVYAEAIDRNGNSLGKSSVFKTLPPSQVFSEPVLKEEQWVQDHSHPKHSPATSYTIFSQPLVAFAFGVGCCALGLLMALVWTSRSKLKQYSWWQESPGVYEKVLGKEDAEETMAEDGEEKGNVERQKLLDR